MIRGDIIKVFCEKLKNENLNDFSLYKIMIKEIYICYCNRIINLFIVFVMKYDLE